MTLSRKQIDEMKSAAMPLMIWLEKNCHPHVHAIVHNTQIEVLEGFAVAHRIAGQGFDRAASPAEAADFSPTTQA